MERGSISLREAISVGPLAVLTTFCIKCSFTIPDIWTLNNIHHDEMTTFLEIESVSKRYQPLRRKQLIADDFEDDMESGDENETDEEHSIKPHDGWALRDISFSISAGERVAIVGGPGSGKTTLIKMITGSVLPTEGNIRGGGRTVLLTSFATPISPIRSVRQNIYLIEKLLRFPNGALTEEFLRIGRLGNDTQWIDKKAGHTPRGIYTRLVAIPLLRAHPEIILIDDGLKIDPSFQSLFEDSLNEASKQGSILLHSFQSLFRAEKWCDRAIWLENGQVKMDAAVRTVIGLNAPTEADTQVRAISNSEATSQHGEVSLMSAETVSASHSIEEKPSIVETKVKDFAFGASISAWEGEVNGLDERLHDLFSRYVDRRNHPPHEEALISSRGVGLVDFREMRLHDVAGYERGRLLSGEDFDVVVRVAAIQSNVEIGLRCEIDHAQGMVFAADIPAPVKFDDQRKCILRVRVPGWLFEQSILKERFVLRMLLFARLPEAAWSHLSWGEISFVLDGKTPRQFEKAMVERNMSKTKYSPMPYWLSGSPFPESRHTEPLLRPRLNWQVYGDKAPEPE